jgi:hypothetical protein
MMSIINETDTHHNLRPKSHLKITNSGYLYSPIFWEGYKFMQSYSNEKIALLGFD